jgi:DNA-binding SARP family transcriptional activator
MQPSLSSSQKPAPPEAGICFYLLGTPGITWNGYPLVIPRRSVRALLYRLACEGKPVSRGHLHLLFWPDQPESTARRNLSHHLTHLRRALPLPQTLVTTHDRVWLEPDQIWCDALQFKTASLDSPIELFFLQHLADMYRGSFLEGFELPGCSEFEHWCIVERVALEGKYLKALGQLVERCTDQGEISQAIQYARRYLEIDGLSESMHQHLIQLYAASGERHLALQQFERCTSTLARELNIGPLPETRAIYQAVLHGMQRFPEPPTQPHTAQLPEGEPPLIGRQDELHLLEDVYLRLQSQRSQVVLICGEAGIGKTRLMQEFANRHQGEARLLYGHGLAGEQAIPYQPILQILRAILGLGEFSGGIGIPDPYPELPRPDFVEPLWLSEVSRLLPEMHAVYPDLASPLALEPESARTRLFDALCRVILAYSTAHGPVLLCLDDLQWMDPATKAWLVHIGRFLKRGGYPLLILGTYRGEESEAILDLRNSLVHTRILTELRLSRLDQDAVLRLVRALIGGRLGDEMLASQLYHATGGNPFYLIETLHKLIEEGRITEEFQRVLEFTLPESVREAIQARLQLLSPIARQVLEAGAVLGQSFGIDLLRLTAGRSHTEIMTAVEELVSRILLVENLQDYHFVHELTRQHVADSLRQVRGQLLHLRAARAYQRLVPDAFTTLAHHFERGGDLSRALQYHALAAQRAGALFAWQEVEFHQGRMLDLLERVDPDGAQPELLIQRGEVLAERAHTRYLLGQRVDRDADLDALSDLGESKNDDRVRLQAILNRLRYLNLDGEYPQAIALAERGLALLDCSPTLSQEVEKVRLARSRLLAQTGFAYYFLGEPEEALCSLEEAWCHCNEDADPEACGRIQHILGYVYFHLGDYARALECQQRGYACHEQLGDYNRMAWDLIDIGTLHKNLGSLDEAQDYLRQGLDLSRRVGSLQAEAYGLAHFGSLNLCQGEYSAASTHFLQVLELQQGTPSEHVIATAEAGVGLAQYHLGDYAQCRYWLERALLRARGTGHRRRTAETLIELGMLDTADGCLQLARQHLEEGLAIARASQSGECLAAGLCSLARLERLAGDPGCAVERAAEAVRASQRASLACGEMWGEIEAGLAYLDLGDLSSALAHTRQAVSLAPQASQDWIGREEAYRSHARVLEALNQPQAAARQEALARKIIRAKADLVPDPTQRRRYLSLTQR